MKRNWAKNILFRAWGVKTFVRVYLRRELGRQPTREELAEHTTLPERKRIEKLVSIEEIINAYANDQEVCDRIHDEDILHAHRLVRRQKFTA